MRRSLLGAAALVLALAGSAAAEATATQSYRVKQKDTLELIAAEFYGERAHATFIIAENKLKQPRVRPFERLRIPVTREITTGKGDTFESLAETYLGDKRRARILATYNDMPVDESLATGTVITIPFHITHVAQNTETLAQVASRYLGDGKQAQLLRDYNFLDKSTLEKAEPVLVPVLNVRVRPAKLPAADEQASLRRRQHAKSTAMAAQRVPQAQAAWLQGDFAHVKERLAELGTFLEYLDSKTAVTVGMLLGKAHLAFGETDAAIAALKEVHARDARFQVNAYSESPKVIEAWNAANPSSAP